jgi:hypothetical protein
VTLHAPLETCDSTDIYLAIVCNVSSAAKAVPTRTTPAPHSRSPALQAASLHRVSTGTLAQAPPADCKRTTVLVL